MDGVEVTLPDGERLEVPRGTTVAAVADEIGPGLGEDCLAGVVDGSLVAAEYRIRTDVTLRVVTPTSDRYAEVVRRTASQVLAHAVERLFPGADLVDFGVSDSTGSWSGSPVDRFYCDFAGLDVDGDDLAAIQAEMETIRETALDIDVSWLTPAEAESALDDGLPEGADASDELPVYTQGEFTDLGASTHLPTTRDLAVFEVTGTSAVHGDDAASVERGSGGGTGDDATLTRVRGVAFPDEDEYEAYREFQAEVERRDHVRIGDEMGLFETLDHAPGCPHFYPDGQTVLRELEEFVRELDESLGFEEVQTPELNKTDLWETSGHYSFFFEHDDAYAWTQDGEEYGLKPTDCPNHMRLFDAEAHSYRDLPVRYTEMATIYRKHKSGETKGITRTRRYVQPDAHLFVRPDQVREELLDCVQAVEELADTFDLGTAYTLATRDDDTIGDEPAWEAATERLRGVLDDAGVDYEVRASSAFYAPEIEVEFVDDLGRHWKGSGLQLDVQLPERFDLTYVGEDGDRKRPAVIHRGLLVSFEYLLGLLLEHFEGRLPAWLSPTQVQVVPVTDDSVGYAASVADRLGEFRVEVDDRSWTLSRKLRAAHERRVPYMVVVGDDEREAGTVAVRNRDGDEVRGVDPDEFASLLRGECDQRRPATGVVDRLDARQSTSTPP